MKKSELKNIIKETIKELVSEQIPSPHIPGTGCNPQHVQMNYPFNFTFPGNKTYEIHGPSPSFKREMEEVLVGPEGCRGLYTKQRQAQERVDQMFATTSRDLGDNPEVPEILNQFLYINHFLATNLNSSGCAYCRGSNPMMGNPNPYIGANI